MCGFSILFPGKLCFGNNCLEDFIREFTQLQHKRALLIYDPNVIAPMERLKRSMEGVGKFVFCNKQVSGEPNVEDYYRVLHDAEHNNVDAVIGIGGGSILDVAKLVAALCHTGRTVEAYFEGKDIGRRSLFLACLPTTAGAGSEVSPNAILYDKKGQMKRAVVSPSLIPDMSFIDPLLTHSVPPHITASTGIDALTHCIEAYTNKFATALTDLYALEGIGLISRYLFRAYEDGTDSQARWGISLGSMYGGLCLGPVNTAAVHALAYPLGSFYQVPHGVSNAILLPHVMRLNLPYGTDRYATIARRMGIPESGDELKMARSGIAHIEQMCRSMMIPEKLSEFDIPVSAIHTLTQSAMGVQRLLKNNLRALSEQEIEKLYLSLF